MESQRLNDYAARQADLRGDAAFHEQQPDEILADIDLAAPTITITRSTEHIEWWTQFIQNYPQPAALEPADDSTGTPTTDPTRDNFATETNYFFQDGMHPAEVIPRVFQLLTAASRQDSTVALTLMELPAHVRSCALGHTHSADHRCALIHIDRPDITTTEPVRRQLSAHCHSILQVAIDEGRIRLQPQQPVELPPYNQHLTRYLLAGGTQPRHILRRVYFLAKGWFPDLINGAALRVLADLSGETKQNWSGYALNLRDELRDAIGLASSAVKYAKTNTARETYKLTAKTGWETRRNNRDQLRILK